MAAPFPTPNWACARCRASGPIRRQRSRRSRSTAAPCPLNEDCTARRLGTQETFPRKAPKKSGALRRGAAFVVTRGDELLVRSRPEKGLLGGMTEVPGSDWRAGQEDATAKQQAPELKGGTPWRRRAGVVAHVFTHFPLELAVHT